MVEVVYAVKEGPDSVEKERINGRLKGRDRLHTVGRGYKQV